MRYAVGFSVYYWDAFVGRQYARVRERVRADDLFVLVDATSGAGPSVPARNQIAVTRSDIRRLVGEVPRPTGHVGLDNVIWYNLDLLGYRLFEAEPDYDYALVLDYDALLNVDLDAVMEAVRRDDADFVAEPAADLGSWSWTFLHAALYPGPKLKSAFVAATIVSKRASMYLRMRRRLLALDHARGDLAVWPFCEAFMPSELAHAGFRVMDLARYADTSRFRWRPVQVEAEIMAAAPLGFIHPVRPQDDGAALYRRIT